MNVFMLPNRRTWSIFICSSSPTWSLSRRESKLLKIFHLIHIALALMRGIYVSYFVNWNDSLCVTSSQRYLFIESNLSLTTEFFHTGSAMATRISSKTIFTIDSILPRQVLMLVIQNEYKLIGVQFLIRSMLRLLGIMEEYIFSKMQNFGFLHPVLRKMW